jgi:hypothetical protein
VRKLSAARALRAKLLSRVSKLILLEEGPKLALVSHWKIVGRVRDGRSSCTSGLLSGFTLGQRFAMIAPPHNLYCQSQYLLSSVCNSSSHASTYSLRCSTQSFLFRQSFFIVRDSPKCARAFVRYNIRLRVCRCVCVRVKQTSVIAFEWHYVSF